MPGNTRGFARQFTLEEVLLANSLRHDKGWEWEAIASRIGEDVLPRSVSKVVERYRVGKWYPKRPRTRPLRAKLEVAVVELGVTDVSTLCEFFKITEDIASYNLRQMGLDSEMRKQVRRERDMAVLMSVQQEGRLS